MLILIGIFWVFTSFHQATNVEPVFGVRISYSTSGTMNTYALFLKINGRLTKKRIVKQDDFVKFVSGHWPSIYNPERKNLFKEHDVPCSVMKEDFTNKDLISCDLLQNLWKIRFDENPFMRQNEPGWSNDQFWPSKKQQVYLYEEYGIKNIDLNFFVDTSFWKLLNDIQNPTWIGKYKSLG